MITVVVVVVAVVAFALVLPWLVVALKYADDIYNRYGNFVVRRWGK